MIEDVSAKPTQEAVATSGSALLEVNNLKTWFYTADGIVRAVNGISYRLGPGEALGLVGESGCGKSVSALSLMRLIPTPPGKIVEARSSSTVATCSR